MSESPYEPVRIMRQMMSPDARYRPGYSFFVYEGPGRVLDATFVATENGVSVKVDYSAIDEGKVRVRFNASTRLRAILWVIADQPAPAAESVAPAVETKTARRVGKKASAA